MQIAENCWKIECKLLYNWTTGGWSCQIVAENWMQIAGILHVNRSKLLNFTLPRCVNVPSFRLSWCVIQSISVHHWIKNWVKFKSSSDTITGTIYLNCNIIRETTKYITDFSTGPGCCWKCLKTVPIKLIIDIDAVFKWTYFLYRIARVKFFHIFFRSSGWNSLTPRRSIFYQKNVQGI